LVKIRRGNILPSRRRLSVLLAVLACLAQGLNVHGEQPAVSAEFIPGQVLVQFRQGAPVAARAAAADVIGAAEGQSIASEGTLRLLTTDMAVADAIEVLESLPDVEFAQPNFIYRHDATSNDPYYTNGLLWGMYGDATTPANQYGSGAAELWADGFTGSNTVYVGVVDEGIDFNHPDLSANVWTNPFDPVNGVDDDGNGRIDDLHGWDFDAGDNSVYDGLDDDHGTHVAGTIGARGGNGTGVVGVNWNVKLISAKFLNGTSGGGTTAKAIQALDYITDLKTRHNLNIVATNNSWSNGGYDPALHAAVIRGAKQNILLIAAASNGGQDQIGDNNDSAPRYPANFATDVAAGGETAASYDAVISVASITLTGARSTFSNYGATSVDLGAPGSQINSTLPGNSYGAYDGTSMATPHVAGAVALYQSIHPSATASQIRSAILSQVTPTTSLSGITVTGGRLNVGAFATVATSLSINDVSVTEGNSGTANATFTASLSVATPRTVTVNYATADGTATLGSVTDTTYSNSASIAITSPGLASPYPSNITVPSGFGPIEKVTARLTGFTHTGPADVDIMLAGPNGQAVILLSDAGSSTDVSNLTLTFDDSGVAATTGPLTSTTYRPTNLEAFDTWASPCPGFAPSTTLSGFNGLDPAGVWRLCVFVDTGGNTGSISGGWSLTITAAGATGDYAWKSGSLTFSPFETSKTVAVAINGDTTFEASETFAVNLSNPTFATIGDSQGVGTILNDDHAAFTDPTITAGLTVIKAIHVTELRTRINAVRVARGLSNFAFTDPTLTATSSVIKAVHITEMRTALNAAYTAAGMTLPSYSGATPAVGLSVLRIAITELRSALLAIE
jgi:thermitase